MHILVAPLDWGLGHATRCIPIINYLLRQHHSIHIAANGRALALLRQEFPHLPYTELAGYDIRYPNNKNSAGAGTWAMAAAMCHQVPRILYRIWREYRTTQTLVQAQKIEVIISDNRYGCRSPLTRNILVCHQIFIQIPPPFAWLMPCVAYLHQWFIASFDQCWIPDYADPSLSLSGSLSRYRPLPAAKYVFIGILSRFAPLLDVCPLPALTQGNMSSTIEGNRNTTTDIDRLSQQNKPSALQPQVLPQQVSQPHHAKRQYRYFAQETNDLPLLLVLISGPEPSRSDFERLILAQVNDYRGNIFIVRGMAEGTQLPYLYTPRVMIADHLDAQSLRQLLIDADKVIARAGYSTVMDLAALQKKALLVPTPGQTEQMYLGQYLAQRALFGCIAQNKLRLSAI